jgi:acetoacetyl-CoA synthetase
MTAGTGPPELLRPVAADVRESTEIGRFLGWLERERGLRFDDYQGLHRFSVEDLEGFWSAVAEFFGVRFSDPPQRVLGRREMPGAEWFPGATLNYAEHALGLLEVGENADEVAVLGYSQTRDRHEVTWGQLREQVARARAGL